jgi:hypothetical protein
MHQSMILMLKGIWVHRLHVDLNPLQQSAGAVNQFCARSQMIIMTFRVHEQLALLALHSRFVDALGNSSRWWHVIAVTAGAMHVRGNRDVRGPLNGQTYFLKHELS